MRRTDDTMRALPCRDQGHDHARSDRQASAAQTGQSRWVGHHARLRCDGVRVEVGFEEQALKGAWEAYLAERWSAAGGAELLGSIGKKRAVPARQ